MDLEKIDVNKLKDGRPGGCFHGEVWVTCPHCGKAVELVGLNPIMVKDGYYIFKCKRCYKYFRDR